MNPRSIPNDSCRTLATGARQFVVHEALETIRASGVSTSSLTPSTTIASTSSFGGTVRITFFAPARRCGSIFARCRKTPVDSITRSTRSSAHGRRPGSRSAVSRIRRPSTSSAPSSQDTGRSKRPITVSYLSR